MIFFSRFCFSSYVSIFLVLLEGANQISVYGRQTRTTNALEAYNGVIGRRMTKKGQFFAFLKILLHEEYIKCKEFSDLARTGGESGRKRRYRVCILYLTNITDYIIQTRDFVCLQSRNEQINECGIKLERDEITPIEFLRACIFDGGIFHKGLDDFDNVRENPDDVGKLIHLILIDFNVIYLIHPDVNFVFQIIVIDDDDDNMEIEAPEMQVQGQSQESQPICAVCRAERPTRVMMSCGHICVCEVCFAGLKNTAEVKNYQ